MRVPMVLFGVAGVALYGSYSHFSAPSGRLAQLAHVSEIITGGGSTMTDAPAGGPRVFSPQKPLLAQASDTVAPPKRRVAETVPSAPVAPVPVQVTRRSDPFGEAPAIQAVQPKAQVQAPAANRKASGSARPASEEAKATLVRDLQRELKRVGCFDGELSGWWNQGTRRAMSAFTERVNASLPVEEPDYILLALVQSQVGQVCGTTCPAGQTSSAEGRCVPRAILAQGDGRKTARSEQQPAKETPGEADRRLQQSAAAFAGQLAAPAAPTATARGRSWETGVFPAAPQLIPAMRAGSHAPAATAYAPQPVEPLPGRMGIGAPIAPQPDSRLAPPATTASLPPAVQPDDDRGSAGSSYAAPGYAPPPRAAAPGKRAPRYVEYQPAPRPYYAPPPSRSRGPGPNLRSQQNVKDFFFGASRGSF